MDASVPSEGRKTSAAVQVASFALEGSVRLCVAMAQEGFSVFLLEILSCFVLFFFFFLKLLHLVPSPEKKTVGEKCSMKELFLA